MVVVVVGQPLTLANLYAWAAAGFRVRICAPTTHSSPQILTKFSCDSKTE